jgi:hypothetical protein
MTTDMTTVDVVYPAHWPVFVLHDSGVSVKFQVIAETEDKAIGLIMRNYVADESRGKITQLFAEKQVPEQHTRFVKAFTP